MVETITSKRLVLLRESLRKKEVAFQEKLDAHFEDVGSANGQPLNDKRNGGRTMDRWDRQNDALRNRRDGIERTKRAIEREEASIANVASINLPDFIQAMVDSGSLIQWRRHPNTFFVHGVDKGRIVWNPEHKTLSHRYVTDISKSEYPKFRDVFNMANAALRSS